MVSEKKLTIFCQYLKIVIIDTDICLKCTINMTDYCFNFHKIDIENALKNCRNLESLDLMSMHSKMVCYLKFVDN